MLGTLDHRHGLCVLGRRGLSVCLLDGGGKVDVGKDSCGLVYGKLCDVLNPPSSCKCRYPEMVGGHPLLFPW